eukprot:7076777-Prymnesium_polylepis.1
MAVSGGGVGNGSSGGGGGGVGGSGSKPAKIKMAAHVAQMAKRASTGIARASCIRLPSRASVV